MICCTEVIEPPLPPRITSDVESEEDLDWLENPVLPAVRDLDNHSESEEDLDWLENSGLSVARHVAKWDVVNHFPEIEPLTENYTDSHPCRTLLGSNVSRPWPWWEEIKWLDEEPEEESYEEFKSLVEETEEDAVKSEITIDTTMFTEDTSLRGPTGTRPAPTIPAPLPVLTISPLRPLRTRRFQASSHALEDDVKECADRIIFSALREEQAINSDDMVSSDEALARLEELWIPDNWSTESVDGRLQEDSSVLGGPRRIERLDLEQSPRPAGLGRWDVRFRNVPSPVHSVPRPFFFISPPDLDDPVLNDIVGSDSRGVKQSIIDELPTRKFVVRSKPEDEKTEDVDSNVSEGYNMCSCVICMEVFETSEDVKALPCLHIYHTQCIDKWLSRNCTCPICKRDVTKTNRGTTSSPLILI